VDDRHHSSLYHRRFGVDIVYDTGTRTGSNDCHINDSDFHIRLDTDRHTIISI